MDPCRRPGCGDPFDVHQYYRGGTDCALPACECPQYLGPQSPRRTLAAAGCSVAAAALAGVVWWRMVSGYDGAALAWLGLGSIGFVIVGANIADHQGGGPGEH
jgi:hypothetical protein